jgi:hypothetical protein
MLRTFRRTACLVCLAALAAAPSSAAEVEAFLPKETDVVINLNVRQVLDSQVFKKHALDLVKTALANSKEAQAALQALGLDPLKDFDRVSVGLGLEDLNNPKAAIVVQGRFDVTKVGNVFDQLAKNDPKKFSAEKANGKTVYKIATPDQPVPVYAALVDSKTLVFATSKEGAGAAFDVAMGTRKPELRKELADLLKKADPKSSLSVVAYTKGRLESVPLPNDEMKKVLEQIHHITIDLKVESDAKLELVLGAENADAAKKMQGLVDAGLGFARVTLRNVLTQNPELQPVLDLVGSMKVVQKEQSVLVTGSLSAEAIDKMFKKDK